MLSLTEQQFEKLTVIERVGKNKWGHYKWLCRCDCGKEIIVLGHDLKRGHTKSCGCLQKATRIKHGHCGDRTYKSWQHMIQRCTNPNHKQYKDYGGRGITVYEQWLNSFPNFLEDMGECPEGHSIDRIDNNGNYCKSNCRWATRKQQQRNKRDNCYVTYKGEKRLLVELAEEYNINCNTLWHRIYRHGWSIEKALTTKYENWNNTNSEKGEFSE